MVDYRRLDTASVLAAGILEQPIPQSGRPDGVEFVHVDEDKGHEQFRAGLQVGGLEASMYYGCWAIWKTDAGFSGELMQYRNVTDQFTDVPLKEALEKATKWFDVCYG